ncbi:hypothetical protein ANN_13517, partial [Periplaneta americana]
SCILTSTPNYLLSRFQFLTTLRNRHQALLSIPHHRTSLYSSSYTGIRYLMTCQALKGSIEGGGFGPVLWIKFGVAQWSERLVRKTKPTQASVAHEKFSCRDIGSLNPETSFRKEGNLLLLWVRLKERRTIHSLSLLFRIMHTATPNYLLSRFQFLTTLRNRYQALLSIPHHRTSLYSSSYTVEIPRLWNSLPNDVRDCRTLSQFKIKLENFVLVNVFRYF